MPPACLPAPLSLACMRAQVCIHFAHKVLGSRASAAWPLPDFRREWAAQVPHGMQPSMDMLRDQVLLTEGGSGCVDEGGGSGVCEPVRVVLVCVHAHACACARVRARVVLMGGGRLNGKMGCGVVGRVGDGGGQGHYQWGPEGVGIGGGLEREQLVRAVPRAVG